MTEWPKVAVLKTVEALCVSVGSNPTLSAFCLGSAPAGTLSKINPGDVTERPKVHPC